MSMFRYIFLFTVLLCGVLIFSVTSIAGNKCKISSTQGQLSAGTPPLCKGRTVQQSLTSELTGEPDYGDVDDILFGYRELFPVDDLVMMNPTGAVKSGDGASTTIQNFYLFTEDKEISEFTGPDILDEAPCNTNGGNSSVPFGTDSLQQTQVVRMFNLDRDFVLTYAANQDADTDQCLGLSSTGNRNITITVEDPQQEFSVPEMTLRTLGVYQTQSVSADFNNDGFDDVLILNGTYVPETFVISAFDPDNPGLGIRLGPIQSLSSSTNYLPVSSPVVGDFNGDSILDVAWVALDNTAKGSAYKINFASVCPGSTDNIPLCNGRKEFEIILFPLSSNIIQLNTFVDDSFNFYYPAVTLAAGNFDDNPDQSAGDDLIAFYGQRDSKEYLRIDYYTFNSSMSSTLRAFFDDYDTRVWNAYAVAAQLDRTELSDQAVIGWQSRNYCRVWVLVFEGDTFDIVMSDQLNCDKSDEMLNGFAVGRFTDEVAETAQDLDPQMALLRTRRQDCNNCSGRPSMTLWIMESNTNGTVQSFKPNLYSSFKIDSDSSVRTVFGGDNPNRGGSFLHAGDLQGRSLQLGAPSVARIPKYLQVNVIQAAPPMHGDYIQVFDDLEPVVNNFSVIPSSFETKFSTTTSSSTTSSTKSASSYTYSFEEGIKFQGKAPDTFGNTVEVKLGLSAEQLYNCNVSEVNTQYSSNSFGVSTATGFGDQLIYTQFRQNIYYYPVIGQKVCPGEEVECDDSEKLPLYYQISAPDEIYRDSLSETKAEFYQPVHEPGNIFSYPWTRDQLLARLDTNVDNLLTDPNPVGFFTDDTKRVEFADWTQGEGNECTTETSETLSYNESFSISYGTNDIAKKVAGAKVTASFDFGQSEANSTMQSNVSQFTDSTGIEILKTDSFKDPRLYDYRIQPFIMGQQIPEGVWQQTADPTDELEADISTDGSIIVAFTADPSISTAGSWWQLGPNANDYSAYPDLALNHPNFWRVTSAGLNKIEEPPSNCRPNEIGADKANCILHNGPQSDPAKLWASGFYEMRGLIIQVGDEAVGPQVNTAVYGDTVHLTARIYNYSLRDFDPGTLIKAQFYRQRWDESNNEPIGDSILIDELTTTPMPGFNTSSASNAPNWKTVSTSFNTAEEGMQPDTWWIYWVLVWAVDSDGELVAEVPGHGFEGTDFIPGQEYTSIQEVPLQMVSIVESKLDVETSFTNNLGFLPLVFYVAPDNILQELATSGPAEISIENLTIERDNIFVGDAIVIDADIWSHGARTPGLTAALYEGLPDETDVVYDIELIPHILKDSSYNFRVVYEPERCGPRDLYLLTNPNNSFSPAAAMESINLNVQCQPGDTNIEGQLIGDDGLPIISDDEPSANDNGNSNNGCAIASDKSKPDIPLYLIIPIIVAAFRLLIKRHKIGTKKLS